MIDKKYPDWLLRILANSKIIIPIIYVAALGGTIIVGAYMNRRLEKIEGMLDVEPPSNYQAPNLSKYKAGKIGPKSIYNHKAVYVPIYSHVYIGQGQPYLLAATLSIRNTDTNKPLFIRTVDYYNTGGELLKKYIDQLIQLRPLETIDFLVKAKDTSGGSGANFIVEWLSLDKIDEPIIEAVMVGSIGTQGISFLSSGQVLQSLPSNISIE